MSKTLYLECTFGISGDMFVGSLLDLGADEKKLEQALASLPVKGFHTCISRVKKSGLDACDFAVLLDEQHENPDHDMEYLHGAYTKEVCLDSLQIEEVIVPMLSEGQGTVCCQHGILPIPVPAVTQIIRTYGIAIHRLQVQGELVTPTGAAIVAAIRTGEELPEAYRILQIGMGAGKREYETPGILRAMLIEERK